MKKSLAKAMLVLTLASFTAVQTVPRQAKAVVGITAWTPILIGAGLGACLGFGVIGGLGAAGVDVLTDDGRPHGILGWIGTGVSGVVAAFGLTGELAGLIILDGSQSRTIQFTPLNQDDATKLGITSEELESYNSNLDQANAVEANVEADLATMQNPTVSDSSAAWSNYKDALPSPALTAMAKVTSQMARQK